MAKAKIVKQLTVKTPNEVGTLDKVSAALKDAGLNILHLCAWGMEEEATFMVVVSDPDKGAKVLQGLGYEVSQDDVLEVQFESAPGTLSPVAKELGDAGIDLEYIFGTTSDGTKVVGVMSTKNNQKALNLINK